MTNKYRIVLVLGLLGACAAEPSDTALPDDLEVSPAPERPGKGASSATGQCSTRAAVGGDRCHTFDFLRQSAAQTCWNHGWDHAYFNPNFTHGCTGWWGHGAKTLWFTCCDYADPA
jgi:hypothetical protein